MKKYEINTDKELTPAEIVELEKIFNCKFILLSNTIYSVFEETSPQMGMERLVRYFHTREEAEKFAQTITNHRTSIQEISLS